MKDNTDFAYQAVYRYLVRLVDEDQREPALKMPSLRQLARRLQVSISTVQSAYSLLEKEGRIYSVAKSGYYAIPRSSASEEQPCRSGDLLHALQCNARRAGMLLLSGDEPTVLRVPESPLLTMERELARHYPRSRDAVFQPFGEPELRTALAARYTHDAEHCWHADNVYITPDLHGAFKVVIDTLQLRGGIVLVESPCTWTWLRLLQSFDIRVVELPQDEPGSLDPVQLERLLRENTVGLAIFSSFLNPVRGNLRASINSQALAEVINRHQVWVLENDSHSELRFACEPDHLRHLIDPRRLVIIGAFDKSLGPEAPYGYLLCKQLEDRWQAGFLLRAFGLPRIRQRAIARLCGSGGLDIHLNGLRAVLAERASAMTHQLDEQLGEVLRYEVPVGGCGVWAQSRYPVNMRKVFDMMLAERIVIAPGELFSLQGQYGQHLRISYAIDWGRNVAGLLAVLGDALSRARLP
ncbi:PLP-dependent aminotransferase family protein [Pseudomonas syringae]|uniref:GntR family transcriptional regulator n=1 Tax=Pseudomonas syringae TaxID=317 RepID=A0A9Q4A6X8_PSESX|nr:PLP-dependent aminotransferase family protein [Pseudomonas syringae]MCF5469034.1 GntR family transcriptional regulator [Pseudomonas syringae]MCF5471607.1 GntR family transcriptional regulator [Pseudomonas syringae]MCF5482584.1 GntR family transcriptional regulator [Pseudomonas syringae]MCF5489491.1 GntR family transcriptional regulator [Pseudomonas syringae]MCF5494057.1 GntR family transcriptional regulator [Pseudomonas syringae]